MSVMERRNPDPARCKADVATRDRWPSFYQCTRKPVKDGWCRQHHPDAVKAREKASAERCRAKWDKQARIRNKRGAWALLEWMRKHYPYEAPRLRMHIEQWNGEDPYDSV